MVITPISLLDRLFVWLRSLTFFHRMAWFTRILLAVGFFPTGLVKLLGHRFTVLGTDTPVGFFFEAMYQTGFYWRFLGLSQMLAAVLLMVPAASHLGAALFLPIILNIFVITVSMAFAGTPLITGSMLLAVSFLILWDWYRFRPLFTNPARAQVLPPEPQPLDGYERLGFWIFGLALIGFFSGIRVVHLNGLPYFVAAGLAGGLLALGRFLVKLKTDRLPGPRKSGEPA